jgi:SpoVK/Ycf46/Vps4 family AAA+-type ATPase
MITPPLKELTNCLRARFPVIQVVTQEEDRAVAEIAAVVKAINLQIYMWSCTRGLLRDGQPAGERTTDLGLALDFFEARAKESEKAVLVLLDAHPFVGPQGSPLHRRKLRELAIAIRNKGYRCNLILVGPSADVAEELQKEVHLLDYPLPDATTLRQRIKTFSAQHGKTPGVTIDLPPDVLDKFVEAARGLNLNELDNCLARALVEDHRLDESDLKMLLQEKRQIVKKSGLLEFVEVGGLSLEDVGGLSALKHWLILRSRAFTPEARRRGIKEPRGVLVTGIPGCGKSLAAQCVAAFWGRPLLRFDIGRVFQGIVGSSEANMRRALSTAEAVAPAVVWIDEIEKGLGNVQNGLDGGAGARVFGTILTWMQEKTAPVFVFATANDISSLPPELLRKGRFDEIFFVDLPTQGDRLAILKLKLNRLGVSLDRLNLDLLARWTGEEQLGGEVRFSGSELEEWVNESLLEAFVRADRGLDGGVCMDDFEVTLKRTVPMAQTRAEEFRQLRKWADQRAVNASARSSVTPGAGGTAPVGRLLDFESDGEVVASPRRVR